MLLAPVSCITRKQRLSSDYDNGLSKLHSGPTSVTTRRNNETAPGNPQGLFSYLRDSAGSPVSHRPTEGGA
eukprot:7806-Eustigmatos_ZCMA.PRE.1